MRRLFVYLITVLFTANVFAQAPEKMSYQAVIRNSNDVLVTNSQVGMQISILQGSVSGTAVYTETLTPTTNANGLASIEIGSGNVISGDFQNIDWAVGPYFIKTETDPAGGTNYTINGTSQLLSVPYALHAKTAETVTGIIFETDPVFGTSVAGGVTAIDTANWNNKLDSYTESDPVFGASVAGGITAADTTNWNNKLDSYTESDPVFSAWNKDYNDLINKPNIADSISAYVDGSETKIAADTNITVTGIGTNTDPYVIKSVPTHYVGELYGGGVVFWVDHTTHHGFIISMVDLSTSHTWSNITNAIVGASSYWDGAGNTTAIIGQSGHTTSAAQLCEDYINDDYGTGVYSDWYLPSIAELNYMWNNFYEVQKALDSDGNPLTNPILRQRCWSSTESDGGLSAWTFYFDSGIGGMNFKDNTNFVRAARAF